MGDVVADVGVEADVVVVEDVEALLLSEGPCGAAAAAPDDDVASLEADEWLLPMARPGPCSNPLLFSGGWSMFPLQGRKRGLRAVRHTRGGVCGAVRCGAVRCGGRAEPADGRRATRWESSGSGSSKRRRRVGVRACVRAASAAAAAAAVKRVA